MDDSYPIGDLAYSFGLEDLMPNGRGNTGIGDVTVDKKWLLATLKTNREKHRETFERAVEVFRRRAEYDLRELISKIHKGEIPRFVGVHLPIPEEHTEDYDRAIHMLENSINDTATLSEHAYAQLVDDDWGWARDFATNTASYLVTS